jgi:hypothetical protein
MSVSANDDRLRDSADDWTQTLLRRADSNNLVIASRSRVTEESGAECVDVERQRLGQIGEEVAVLSAKLSGRPGDGVLHGGRDRWEWSTVIRIDHETIAIAAQITGSRAQLAEAIEDFTGHRSEREIAAQDEQLDVSLFRVSERGLEGRQIAVHVVEGSHRAMVRTRHGHAGYDFNRG